MRNLFFRIAVVAGLLLGLALPAAAQLEGGRSPAFSNIGIGFGARAMALGGAFIAIADDITAINYNPAGLAWLLKPEFSLGGVFGGQTIRMPRADLSASMTPGYDYYFSNSSEIIAKGFDFSYVGLVVPLRIAGLPVAIGFAHQVKGSNINADYEYSYFDSFGVTIDGVSSHVEQSVARSIIRAGTTSTITASLAARPLEFLSVGFNLNFWRGNESENDTRDSSYDWYTQGTFAGRSLRTYVLDSVYRISGGISYDAGLLVKLKAVSLGVVYKSPFRADYSYDYEWEDIWNSVPGMNGGNSLAGKIFWPSSFGAGLAFRPLDLLTVCADYTSTQWSRAKIDLGEGYVPWDYPADDPQDSRQIRAGVEYLLSLKGVIVPVRAGWFDDRVYWNDAHGEPVKFTGLTAGTGLVFKKLILDLSAIYHIGVYLAGESDLAKTRRSNWDLLASVSYRLGR